MQKLSGRFLTGSAILFVSMTIVNGGNYLFNLILGRWLGPAAFADLSLIVTLMLMITFLTATFQLTAAKFAASYAAEGDTQSLTQVQQWLNRQAWIWGTVALVVVAGGAPLWKMFFHTQSVWPFIILGAGLPIYLVQGVDRGIRQGETDFIRLAVSYQAEMWARLIIGVALVALGWSVNGAVIAITISFAATWLVVRQTRPQAPIIPQSLQKQITTYAGPVIIVHVSQILINNSDILIVKRFFISEEAGLYAALALIGRIVFFATWSIVTVLFPIVAQKEQKGESHRHLLGIGLGVVTLVSAVIIGIVWIFPEPVVSILFGEAYLSIAPLLWLYAVATALYAMANVVITYRLSANATAGTWIALGFGIAQIVGLTVWHGSLQQVVMVQIGLMGSMLVVLLIWDLWLEHRPEWTTEFKPTLTSEAGSKVR